MTTEDLSPEKRMAPGTSSGINSLIAAANKHDRFHLLEDQNVLPANLDNPIHPIFWWFDCDGPLQQMLRLASHFLTHDTVLTFFVPLLYGRELTTNDGKAQMTYLSDPMASASRAKRDDLIDGVRQALHCLAHSIEFRFMVPEKRVYARTLTNSSSRVHASNCSSVFQRRLTARIEIADRFLHFYKSEEGYAASSRCAQFRHDFLLASTLVHEIVHAVGVMRRGNLIEPRIRAEHPDTEWGYAWEHFMFGCIINPQDRTRPGTHLLMRKVWADTKVAEEAGGKEYSDVSMSYIAQWFRNETWDIIASRGPRAIRLPIVHFKIQSSHKHGAWIVSANSINIRRDILALHQQWRQQSRKLGANGLPVSNCSRILLRPQTARALQKSNVPTPSRMYRRPRIASTKTRKLKTTQVVTANTKVTVQEADTPANASRKRLVESMTESTTVHKKVKREKGIRSIELHT